MTRYHDGLLWTSVGAPEPVATTGTGKELRIPLENDVVGNGQADPAVNGGPVFHQLTYATCAYLLNYPDAAGAAGRVLRPEVAAAMPDISPDGRTYTFRIRPGFRFSPPSGQAVTAETFKATIERALSPKFAPRRAPEPDRRAAVRRRRCNGVRRREGVVTSAASRRAATRSRSA